MRKTIAAVAMAAAMLTMVAPASAHQWHKVHGWYYASVVNAAHHRWKVSLTVDRKRLLGHGDLTAECVVKLETYTDFVDGEFVRTYARWTRTVTIADGDTSVFVKLGRVTRFPDADPPDPNDFTTGDAQHCHRA